MTTWGGIEATLDRGDVLASRAAGIAFQGDRLCPPSPRTYRVPTTNTHYLGFPWKVTASAITVTTPDGRHLGKVRSERMARKLVRAYRRAA